jgi:DUF971 family protein
LIPKKISILDKRYLKIEWNDGSENMISLASLRKNCPCATCVKEKENLPKSFIPLLSTASLTLTNIKTAGSYGIQLFWQDGHNTGIYTYDSLKNWKN